MSKIATCAGARAMVLAATAALAGCALGPRSHTGLEHRAQGVDTATVAWAMAEPCRDEHPATDPRAGGPVPVLAHADGSFTIQIARLGIGSPYRCAMDGRLTEPTPELRADGALVLAPPTFLAAGTRTRAPGSSDFLEIVVRPAAGESRSPHVHIETAGDAASPTLRARLEAAMDALRVGREAADWLAAGNPKAAAAATAALLEELDRRGVTGLGVLLAPIHAQLAAARTAQGDLARARQSLSIAMRAAPQCAALGQRVAALDERLARTDASSALLGQLASDPRGGAATRIAAGTPDRVGDPSRGRSTTARIAHREARRRLHGGDVEGAAAWASRALEHAGDPTLGLDLELARARGDHRSAFVLGVEQLARFGFDPELVLGMADDAAAYGDPAAGVRLLARHWNELEREAPRALRSSADRLAAHTGIDLTARIAMTERCRALSTRVLDPLARTDTPRELARNRLASLRRRVTAPAPWPMRLDAGFENAPGVTPAR